MVLTTLSDGSVSCDCRAKADFNEVYTIEFRLGQLGSESYKFEDLLHDIETGKFGAWRGYVFNNKGKICSTGTISGGGMIVIHPEFYGLVYIAGATKWKLFFDAAMDGKKFNSNQYPMNFEQLLPTAVPMTNGSRYVGGCPDAYAVVGDKIFESYPGASGFAGYPSLAFGTLAGGRLTKAFGIKTGSWNLDYFPKSKKGGFKSLFLPQSHNVAAKQFADDMGISIMSSSEVSAYVEKIQNGMAIQDMKALGTVYKRPVSQVFDDNGLLYIAACPTHQGLIRFECPAGVVDPVASDVQDGKGLTDAIYAAYQITIDRNSESAAAACAFFSSFLFGVSEVMSILEGYASIFNRILTDEAQAVKEDMITEIGNYNDAVTKGYQENVSLVAGGILDKIGPMVGDAALIGLDTPLPFDPPYVTTQRVRQVEITPANAVAFIREVFEYYISATKGYLSTRESTDAERNPQGDQKPRFCPVVFHGDSLQTAFVDAVAGITSSFADKINSFWATLCCLPGHNKWATDLPANTGGNVDTYTYDHGCGDHCDMAAIILRTPESLFSTIWSTMFDENGAMYSAVDNPKAQTLANQQLNGFKLKQLCVNSMRKKDGRTRADLTMIVSVAYIKSIGGFWNHNARCIDYSKEYLSSALKAAGLGDNFKLKFLSFGNYGVVPQCFGSSENTCRKWSAAWYGPVNRESLVLPTVWSVTYDDVDLGPAYNLEALDSSGAIDALEDNIKALLAYANRKALMYLLEELEAAGIIGDTTFVGSGPDGKILNIPTLCQCTNFVLDKDGISELKAALVKIRDCKLIEGAAVDPTTYAQTTADAVGQYALTESQRNNVKKLIEQIDKLEQSSNKIWACAASTPAAAVSEDLELIPYVLKV